MDLEVYGGLEEVADILRRLGFVVSVSGDRLEAKLGDEWGRFHVLGAQLKSGLTYLDVHWDFKMHLLFIGVDYKERPKKICENAIEKAEKMGLKARVTGGASWFNRRNKAIFKGLKL